ncbi:MAG: putative toxin-antitoxin system toxin component, PIN family [Bacteriovoracia bacterium]
MNNLKAVIDTNVLYSSMARDILLWLATYDLFQPVWSEKILQELYFALKKLPKTERVKLITRLKEVFPDALIEQLPETGTIHLPDEDDLHIVACALASNAATIITFNLKDFPADELAPIKAISPDDFCLNLLEQNDLMGIKAITIHWRGYQNPKISWEEYTARLNRARLHKLSRKLKKLDLSSAGL